MRKTGDPQAHALPFVLQDHVDDPLTALQRASAG
jgi:hypothetical protein